MATIVDDKVTSQQTLSGPSVLPKPADEDSADGRAADAGQQRGEQQEASRTFRDERVESGVNWWVLGWVAVIHLGALAAPFTFTWTGLLLVVALHWFTGGIGICLGYHRLLTHGSFQTFPFVRWTLAVIGSLAGEGAAIDWVADHRKHHALSDQDGDPHSPRDGGWWSHAHWLFFGTDIEPYFRRWAPDLWKDPVLRAMRYWFVPANLIFIAIVGGIGYLAGGWQLALSTVVWGVFVRLVLVMHSTWLVNSASHMWGYRNYETTDDSRNNWWVALITYGEGWHNNHHAYPRMARHGHRWWEIDLTFWAVRTLQVVGLAWSVVDYKSKKMG